MEKGKKKKIPMWSNGTCLNEASESTGYQMVRLDSAEDLLAKPNRLILSRCNSSLGEAGMRAFPGRGRILIVSLSGDT